MVDHQLSRRALLGVSASAHLVGATAPARLLVVTGGHDFDLSFWEIFKNRTEWKIELPTTYPHPAFSTDGTLFLTVVVW